MEHSHVPRGPPASPQQNQTGNGTEDSVGLAMLESTTVADFHPPCASPPPKQVEWVYNPADGSVLHDHRGRPISVDRMLNTKPLRKELCTRPGPGGCKLTYMSGEGVSRALNDIFGFDGWNLDITKVQREECVKDDRGRFVVVYTAMVRLTHKKSGTYKEDCGAGDAIDKVFGTAVANAIKASITDAMKRAARHFGNKLGNSLYEKSFSINKAPVTLKDALDKQEIERANDKFGFAKDLPAASSAGSPVALRKPADTTQNARIAQNTNNNPSNNNSVSTSSNLCPPQRAQNNAGSGRERVPQLQENITVTPEQNGSPQKTRENQYANGSGAASSRPPMRQAPTGNGVPGVQNREMRQTTNAPTQQNLRPASIPNSSAAKPPPTTTVVRPAQPIIGRTNSYPGAGINQNQYTVGQPQNVANRTNPVATRQSDQSTAGAPPIPGNSAAGRLGVYNNRVSASNETNPIEAQPPKTSTDFLMGSALFQPSPPDESRPSTSAGRNVSTGDQRRLSTGDGRPIQPIPQVTPVGMNNKRPPLTTVQNIDPTNPKRSNLNPYASRRN